DCAGALFVVSGKKVASLERTYSEQRKHPRCHANSGDHRRIARASQGEVMAIGSRHLRKNPALLESLEIPIREAVRFDSLLGVGFEHTDQLVGMRIRQRL